MDTIRTEPLDCETVLRMLEPIVRDEFVAEVSADREGITLAFGTGQSFRLTVVSVSA